MKEKNKLPKQNEIKPKKSIENLGKRSKSVIDIQKYKQEYFHKSASKENSNNLKSFAQQTFQRSQQKIHLCKKIQTLIEQIKQREVRLNSYFQIYAILQNQCGQQRCIQHNNNLSLYCQNQKKILCVHCMYGASKHKTHKVYPLKDCHKIVCQDNKQLKQKISMNLRDLKFKETICEQNIKFLQSQFKTQLEDIEKQYKEKTKNLQKEKQRKTNLLKQCFLPLISANTNLAAKFKVFQKLASGKVQQVMLEQDKKENYEEKQISKHMILQKVNQLTYNQGLSISKACLKDVCHQLIKSRIKSSLKY